LSNIAPKADEILSPLKAPDVPLPESAFFPIHPSLKGVYYSRRVCQGKFVLGVCFGKWVRKEDLYEFQDEAYQGWFKANDYGYCKRPSP
jgi:hypothetical protein